MVSLCNTCKTGANTIEDEPFGCPFVDRLNDGQCDCYIKVKEDLFHV